MKENGENRKNKIFATGRNEKANWDGRSDELRAAVSFICKWWSENDSPLVAYAHMAISCPI